MKLSTETDAARVTPGLRERKKAKTRAAIQHHALRLFREQGYAATTVEQIAAEAEISPSTFFRYFPTKEDVVLLDDFDTVMAAAFRAQPPELSPVQALRRAMQVVYSGLTPADMAEQQERLALARAIPELRAAVLEELIRSMGMISALVAERMGRPADDLAARAFAGAFIGAVIAVLTLSDENAPLDFAAVMEASLSFLEAGMPGVAAPAS
jgi:AcrR family transcriptional regulator